MMEKIDPRKFQEVVSQGFKRLSTYRASRAMFINEYVGQYYKSEKGTAGDKPINLIFHAIRTLVPNIIMRSPENEAVTDIIQHQAYADLLGMGINSVQRRIDMKATLRAWLVDAIFAMGVIKVGISQSDKLLQFGDEEIDPGEIYAELVDLDNLVFDPNCTNIRRSAFIGDRVCVPRQMLLDSNIYDHDIASTLPQAGALNSKKKVEQLSKSNTSELEFIQMQDLVNVVNVWVAEANAIITIPDPSEMKTEKYLAVQDYYGPKSGPYVDLSLTVPVPNNPYPVAPVSIWYDLHQMTNNMFKKAMDQAERQKSIAVCDQRNADLAEDTRDAKDGDVIIGDPTSVKEVKLGGQDPSNISMIQQLQVWFNYMSGNPDQLSGASSDAGTATQANILEANSRVTIEDAKDIVYDRTAEVSRRIAWYLHNDPLIDLPLAKRKPGGERVQLHLTPEQREGDFLEFTFKIKAKSLTNMDPQIRSRRVIEFATKLLPGIMTSANVAMQMGVPFNVQRAIMDLAKELGIADEVEDWFQDPDFMKKLQLKMMMGPQPAGKGTASPSGPEGPDTVHKKQQQEKPAESQSINKGM